MLLYLFIILNSDKKSHTIQLPQHNGMEWKRVIDTSIKNGKDFLLDETIPVASSDDYLSNPKSIVVCISTGMKK